MTRSSILCIVTVLFVLMWGTVLPVQAQELYSLPVGAKSLGGGVDSETILFGISLNGQVQSVQLSQSDQIPCQPPSLDLGAPEVDGLRVRVNGATMPGCSGLSVTRIRWDWGDGRSEDAWFPASHTYGSGGTYRITVTSYQSDGKSTTRSVSVTVSGPTPSANPPSLDLGAPQISGLTVSINGFTSPGTSSATISRIFWQWGDGNSGNAWFPASHTYRSGGTYTITVTAYQSDGLSTTRSVTVTFPIDGSRAALDVKVSADKNPVWVGDKTELTILTKNVGNVGLLNLWVEIGSVPSIETYDTARQRTDRLDVGGSHIFTYTLFPSPTLDTNTERNLSVKYGYATSSGQTREESTTYLLKIRAIPTVGVDYGQGRVDGPEKVRRGTTFTIKFTIKSQIVPMAGILDYVHIKGFSPGRPLWMGSYLHVKGSDRQVVPEGLNNNRPAYLYFEISVDGDTPLGKYKIDAEQVTPTLSNPTQKISFEVEVI